MPHYNLESSGYAPQLDPGSLEWNVRDRSRSYTPMYGGSFPMKPSIGTTVMHGRKELVHQYIDSRFKFREKKKCLVASPGKTLRDEDEDEEKHHNKGADVFSEDIGPIHKRTQACRS